MDELDDVALDLIMQQLDFRSLAQMSLVAKRFHVIAKKYSNQHWRKLLAKYWLIHSLENFDLTALHGEYQYKAAFIRMYSEWGRYVDVYARMRKLWTEIEDYLARAQVQIKLNEGASERELDELEATVGCVLPLDYRCSMRIHNGELVDQILQNDTNSPFLGTCLTVD